MKKAILMISAVCIALGGCATPSSDIAPLHASSMQYQGDDCAQLAREAERLQTRVVQIGGRLDTAAANDKALTGVGVVLFWPALMLLGGTKQQEADYARLRGEYEAVQKSAIVRKCTDMVAARSGNAVASV